MGKRNRLREKHGAVEDILEKYIRAEDRGLKLSKRYLVLNVNAIQLMFM